jgi:predicted RNA-binding Zn ribbon-like protein
MTNTDKPAWAQRPAPTGLAVVQEFLNTHSYSHFPEHFGTVTSARRWLRAQGFTASDLDVDSVAELRRLRERLREVALSHAGHGPADESALSLNHILRSASIAIVITPQGDAVAGATGSGKQRFVNTIAAEVLSASLDGTWRRLKACGNGECAVAFYDHSRNATARYCTTEICANRVRQRTFRQRANNSADR